MLFGEGISLVDLIVLLKAIRDKHLVLQVKIGNGPWDDLSSAVVTKMTGAVTQGFVNENNDIRLRLFDRK